MSRIVQIKPFRTNPFQTERTNWEKRNLKPINQILRDGKKNLKEMIRVGSKSSFSFVFFESFQYIPKEKLNFFKIFFHLIKLEIIPAIDIKDGKCVRLTQGKAGTEKVYYQKPLDAALYWQNEMGSERIHFVDLDAAMGLGDNFDLIKEIVKKCDVK